MSDTPPIPTRRLQSILHTVDLFAQLEADGLDRVHEAGVVRKLDPGEFLFRAGDATEEFFVIVSGAIEIVRIEPDEGKPIPVAYLSPGEVIGEMGLLSGSPRRSSGRAAGQAEVWALNMPKLEGLARDIPGLGLQIAGVLARRLDGFINRSRGPALPKELSGKVQHYDLITVAQTLITSNQTGGLQILDRDGETFAEVTLTNGQVDRARCGAIEGEDAFYQIIQATPEGAEFIFRSVPEPNPDRVSRVRITLSPMKLLVEAMRLAKELPLLRNRLPDPDKAYRARTDELLWEESRTMVAAHEILARLKTPRRLPDLIGEVPCSMFTLYRIAAELYETNQID